MVRLKYASRPLRSPSDHMCTYTRNAPASECSPWRVKRVFPVPQGPRIRDTRSSTAKWRPAAKYILRYVTIQQVTTMFGQKERKRRDGEVRAPGAHQQSEGVVVNSNRFKVNVSRNCLAKRPRDVH